MYKNKSEHISIKMPKYVIDKLKILSKERNKPLNKLYIEILLSDLIFNDDRILNLYLKARVEKKSITNVIRYHLGYKEFENFDYKSLLTSNKNCFKTMVSVSAEEKEKIKNRAKHISLPMHTYSFIKIMAFIDLLELFTMGEKYEIRNMAKKRNMTPSQFCNYCLDTPNYREIKDIEYITVIDGIWYPQTYQKIV
ncbi:hypothetical protein CVIC8964_1532 [Campylobacter vicugnae]|uniref:Uncharacterized protein n=1 Tax=Campylobacter vicugnae TaxID=1660076 RepID=A0A1X9T358_9BACT|nr:hypothetical protein [Campylobacter sp. RM8964]ARR02911.1 hypothetical protein CVIC8964_1532 [Campylobacter sp. RM8964]